MPLKPWFDLVKPREDLAAGKPLDASEFAVHLDQVRNGRAKPVYQNPEEFFERTYLTENLTAFASDVLNRLTGNEVATSAVYDFSTQFGGGKTHSLTLLYHLLTNGRDSEKWRGVDKILHTAQVDHVPKAAVAVFVGTEFDSENGRGGKGEPKRYTPWGEIAFQLGGEKAFSVVAKHDEKGTAPSAEVIREFIPTDRPTLILMDELLNYMGRNRKTGLTGQLYNFVHNLSEEMRGQEQAVLAVSIPSLLDEMTPDDVADFDRFKKLLGRLGKSVLPSAETETTEIIRRRLFDWQGVPREANKTIDAYAEWVVEHRHQLPAWFPVDKAREEINASYPFHPCVVSVFERKWQGLPRFQQTRGILRLLALWVSKVYGESYQKLYKDPLISLGTAPLDDPTFRTAVFEQLGEAKLEAAVTTDIAGKEHAHSLRLDGEATNAVKKARLHRKVATTIFFESNGGQLRGEATLPEVRLSVAEPDLDIGNVEQCLETLADACYYLTAEKNRYRFSFKPNLNKLLADRTASVSTKAAEEKALAEITKVFSKDKVMECLFFPAESGNVPDRPQLVLAVLSPEYSDVEPTTREMVRRMTLEHGASSRTFKNALIWVVAEDSAVLFEAARRCIAWEDIKSEAGQLKLEDTQRQLLDEQLRRAERDLGEAVWRSYKSLYLLAEDNTIEKVDLGRITSSQAPSLTKLILTRLQQDEHVTGVSVSPRYLADRWPPALPEWSIKAVRDAFYSSPRLIRLKDPQLVKETIARGVADGVFAYVRKPTENRYEPFVFKEAIPPADVDIDELAYIIGKDAAEHYEKERTTLTPPETDPLVLEPQDGSTPPAEGTGTGSGTAPLTTPRPPSDSVAPSAGDDRVPGFRWSGDVPHLIWSNFYLKVLSRFANSGGLKLRVDIEVRPEGGVSKQAIQEAQVALRELGLDEDVES